MHAAAEDGKMMCLVTGDRGFLDLPVEVSDTFGYEVYSPDAFFCFVDDSNPNGVHAVAVRQALYWARKQGDVGKAGSLVDALRRAGCSMFAERVAAHLTEALSHPVPGETPRFFIDGWSLVSAVVRSARPYGAAQVW